MSDPITVQKFAIGQSVSRLEDPRLVQGLGRYSADRNLPRAAYAPRGGGAGVWEGAPDNGAFVGGAGSRDAVRRAFADAAHVTRLDFVVTRVAAAPMEPRAAVGEFDRRTGRYTLHTGIQGPHGLRSLLAERIFRVPHGQVRVVTSEVGGSFGMRSGIYPELVLVCWAAKRLR